MYSVTSMDQPRHPCVIVVAGKWTYDAILLSIMSTEFKRCDLPTMHVLDNTRARIIVALFSQAFITSYNAHDKLKEVLNKMHRRVDTVKLDTCFINSHDMSRFYECTKISMAKHGT